MGTVLVTGASGQIGTELVRELQRNVGDSSVIATDIKTPPLKDGTIFEELNVLDKEKLEELVQRYQVDEIYHLAAILSAAAEKAPLLAWNINMTGSLNVLEVARTSGVSKLFIPSSIAAFGPSTPLDNTPQNTIQRPNAIYGITKVAGELLGDYYVEKKNVDCRGVRFPGIISYLTPPGGGTTDYAIDMFVSALRGESYTCYLSENTSLDMMYMPDALRACTQLMSVERSSLTHHNAFNVTSFQLTPARLADAIREHIPSFSCTYEPDPVRQAIADSWPNSMNDQAAREEWGWAPQYNLDAMVKDMLTQLPNSLERF